MNSPFRIIRPAPYWTRQRLGVIAGVVVVYGLWFWLLVWGAAQVISNLCAE